MILTDLYLFYCVIHKIKFMRFTQYVKLYTIYFVVIKTIFVSVKNIIMDTITYYFYYLNSQFSGFSPIVQVTVFLIMLLGGLYLISFYRIFFVAYKLRQENIRRDQVKDKYEAQLERILFSEDNMSTHEVQNYLNVGDHKMKSWEKVYITDLLVKMINENA